MTFYIIRHAHKEKGDYFNERIRHQDEPISAQGRASALKILFAAYNKGMIALHTELYAAAERYGVMAELQGQFLHRGLSLEKIELQITRFRQRGRTIRSATTDRLDACHQLDKRERFDHVVIGPHVHAFA